MSPPYRLVDGVDVDPRGLATATWTPSGAEMGVAVGHTPTFLLVEALAQCAGLALAALVDEKGHWLLVGVDDLTIATVNIDTPVHLAVRPIRQAGRSATVTVSAVHRNDEVASGRLLMLLKGLPAAGESPLPE